MAKSGVQDLARYIAKKHNMTQKDAEKFIRAMFDVVNDGLHHEKQVKVKGLGTFKVIEVKDRESVDVNTGERIVIEGRLKISFTPDSVMKDLVNKPFAQFETTVLNDGVDFPDIETTSTDKDVSDEEFSSEDEVATQTEEQNESAIDNVESFSESQSDSTSELKSADDNILSDSSETNDTVSDNANAEPESVSAEETLHQVKESLEDVQSIKEDIPVETVSIENGISKDIVEDVAVTASQPDDHLVKKDEEEKTVEVVVQQEERMAALAATPLSTSSVGGSDNISSNDTIETDENEKPTSLKWLWQLLVLMAVAGLSFWAGMCYEQSKDNNPKIEKKQEGTGVVLKDSTTNQKDSLSEEVKSVPVDVITIEPDVPKAVQVEKQMQHEELEPKAEEQRLEKETELKKKEAESKEASLSLRTAQSIVSTGAYNIIGTADRVKVRKGQTLKSISRAYFGDGMDCYVIVHNGVSEVKEGDILKIPKIELKKRKRK